MRTRLTFLLVVTAAVGACNCGKSGGSLSRTQARVALSPTAIAFGDVVVGDQKQIDLQVTNIGVDALHVLSISNSAGFPAAFLYSPDQQLTVEPGHNGFIHVFFRPSQEGKISGEFTLNTDSTDDPAVTVPVEGTGVTAKLSASPTQLDFGSVLIGDSVTQPMSFQNTGTATLALTVDDLSGDDAALFHAAVSSSDGKNISLAPNKAVQILVTFTPTARGSAQATLSARACPTCTPVAVPLSGNGIDSALVVTPNPIDVGAVELDAGPKTIDAVVQNISSRTITVKSFALDPSVTVFGLGALADALPFQMVPGAKETLHVTFHPTQQHPYNSTLTITSDDPRAPRLVVPVTGLGGGPSAKVIPGSIDFGTAAVGFPVTRSVTIANVGPPAGVSAANLIVSSATISGSNAAAFAVQLPSGVTFPVTLQPGQGLSLSVKYQPTVASSSDLGTLTLATNDAKNLTVPVSLKGAARAVAPCTYTFAPSSGLQFGVVAPGASQAQSVILSNVGTDVCVIGDLDLSSDSSASFRLKNGPLSGVVIAAGARQIVEVDFAPLSSASSGSTLTGSLALSISASSPKDKASLPLTGTVGESCLIVTPAAIDFGKAPPGCTTLDRILTLNNICQNPVKLISVKLAGADSKDFFISPPPANTVIASGAKAQVKVRFKPLSTIEEHAAVNLVTDETALSGTPLVTPLSGTGAGNGDAEDDFVQSNIPEADILWVIDSSGSMGDKQQILHDNFASFMKFAVTQKIDYHIASIDTSSTEWGTNTHGQIYPLPPSTASRIVTPNTQPDPITVATKNVMVGMDAGGESPFQSAYEALTSPTLNGANAGFLRPEAFLSIIMVGDEDDQSGQHSANFYINFFQNLKGAGNQQLISISNITGGDQGCSGNNINASSAPLFQQLTRATGGVHEDICTVDWARALQRISLAAFGGVKTSFALTGVPDPSTITVKVDGADAAGLWTYDGVQNSISFDPVAVPPAGSHVIVKYTVACQ